ncbi:hypothetical protein NKR23_g33 [Pleurostoma richardsiae]|uniref:Uncharacterized protein n=1 Tax=Pleurostoma richardsiae TaxID=41990 RepID=A0AA38RV54_9PEZI|nr:hypothetical protein NKR23_g33 [Pleurostoma richardsiae]
MLRYATLFPALDEDEDENEHIEFAYHPRAPPQNADSIKARRKPRSWSLWLCLPVGGRSHSDGDGDSGAPRIDEKPKKGLRQERYSS